MNELLPAKPHILAVDPEPMSRTLLDAYNAMLSPRPYRPALTSEKAQQALLAGAGRQWDPVLAALFAAGPAAFLILSRLPNKLLP